MGYNLDDFIKMSDRKPAHGQKVVYYFEHTGFSEGTYERRYIEEMDKECDIFSGTRGWLVDEVTHWLAYEEAQGKCKSLPDDVKSLIAEYGWAGIGVGEDEDSPCFTYSIGLFETYRHPEIIIFGISFQMAHTFICDLVEMIAEDNRTFRPEIRYTDLLQNEVPVYFRKLNDETKDKYLCQADVYYDGVKRFPALQLVWPDKDNRFPWDKDCDPKIINLQILP